MMVVYALTPIIIMNEDWNTEVTTDWEKHDLSLFCLLMCSHCMLTVMLFWIEKEKKREEMGPIKKKMISQTILA